MLKAISQVILAACLISFSLVARAQEPIALQSSDDAEGLQRIAVEYSNTFSGPSLSNPVSVRRYDDHAEDHLGVLHLENLLFGGYRFSPDVSLGVVAKWNWHPGISQGPAFEALDPFLKLSHGALATLGNLTIAGDLRISAPVSQTSANNGLITSLASEQVFAYETGSPLLLGLTTFAQVNIHRHVGDEHQEGDLFEFRFNPSVGYRLSDSLVANVVLELTKTQSRFTDLAPAQSPGSLIEAGVIWDITKNIKFNPNIHTRTSRPLAADSMTIGAKLNWVLL